MDTRTFQPDFRFRYGVPSRPNGFMFPFTGVSYNPFATIDITGIT
jgi:hypothetical protein